MSGIERARFDADVAGATFVVPLGPPAFRHMLFEHADRVGD